LGDGKLAAPLTARVELGPCYWLVRPARGALTAAVRAFAARMCDDAELPTAHRGL
jgi:hypothetical protein